MSDCHVESYMDASEFLYGMFRAQVVHTPTHRVLYTTWPYAREQSAIDRANRWLHEEYQRHVELTLFP